MTEASTSYLAQLQKVLFYIEEHLDEELSVERLCEVAAFSKFHFHRQFLATMGVNVYRYIQLARLKRASFRLAFRETESVLQIALDSGYTRPEAFARAFKERFGQTPTAFRQDPDWKRWNAAQLLADPARRSTMNPTFDSQQVEIIDFPPTPVALLEHRGDPALLGDSIRRFIAWRRQVSLPPRLSATYNLFHSDPETTSPEEYRLDLCAAISKPVEENEYGVVAGQIPGGRCAAFSVTGSSDDLRPAISHLYGEWLPESGEELRDFPVFVERVTFFPDVPEHEAVTKIFLPLK